MSTTKESIKNLKANKYCVIDGEPCRVLSVTTSVSGKHGGAKARLEAVGVFDERKRSIVKPADAEMEVPIIEKRTGQVVALSGSTAQIMDMETYETFDMQVPEELKDQVQQGGDIAYWVLMGKKLLVGKK